MNLLLGDIWLNSFGDFGQKLRATNMASSSSSADAVYDLKIVSTLKWLSSRSSSAALWRKSCVGVKPEEAARRSPRLVVL